MHGQSGFADPGHPVDGRNHYHARVVPSLKPSCESEHFRELMLTTRESAYTAGQLLRSHHYRLWLGSVKMYPTTYVPGLYHVTSGSRDL
jgi:hypothetical protein